MTQRPDINQSSLRWWQVFNPAIYLIESIREFPAQEEMASLIRTAELVNVSYSNMSFGISCTHRGEKPLTGINS